MWIIFWGPLEHGTPNVKCASFGKYKIFNDNC